MEIVSPPPSGLAEDYPHLAPSLATPCGFLVHRKDLA